MFQRAVMSFLLNVGILFQGCDSDVRCRNDNGDEVDWLVENLKSDTLYFHLFFVLDDF